MGRKVGLDGAAYVESGVWRCGESPTGAHHWIELKLGHLPAGTFRCCWCGDCRRFPITFTEAMASKGG